MDVERAFPHETRFLALYMRVSQVFRLLRIVGLEGVSKIVSVHRDMLTYARGYVVPYVINALSHTGTLDDLNRSEGIDPSQYAQQKGLDPNILAPLLQYLYALGLLERSTNGVRLSKSARGLLRRSVGVFDFIHAYSPLFENLESLLTGHKHYGHDVLRHLDYVAKGSTAVTRYLPFPASRRLLRKHRYRALLDLGCGDGSFVFYVIDDLQFAMGIDLAEQAIRAAQERAARRDLLTRTFFKVGDIFELEKLQSELPHAVDVISLMFVLHEFLYHGDEKVLALLRSIKKSFPSSALLVCELCLCSSDELRRRRTAICEHHLFHFLSKQGLATASQWRELFERTGYRIKDEVLFDFAAQAYFLLEPTDKPSRI